MLNLKQLAQFMAIVRTGSLAAAAEELEVSSPGLGPNSSARPRNSRGTPMRSSPVCELRLTDLLTGLRRYRYDFLVADAWDVAMSREADRYLVQPLPAEPIVLSCSLAATLESTTIGKSFPGSLKILPANLGLWTNVAVISLKSRTPTPLASKMMASLTEAESRSGAGRKRARP